MVSNADANRLSLDDTARLRQQASELLNRLIADRDLSERRTAESGKRDPMKSVTGHTAMDSAIASARELIDQMDALLADLRTPAERPAGQIAPAPAPARTPVRSQPRVPHKPALKHETVISAP